MLARALSSVGLARTGKLLSTAAKAMVPASFREAKKTDVRIFASTSHNPWHNLAMEEFIFHDLEITDDKNRQCLFLWSNNPVVVIGRNQNPWKECHIKKMDDMDVMLARRPTGGGAVYQDRGNTNFTLMSAREDYSVPRNMDIVTAALKDLGVNAEATGRNDITVDEKKISGSAFRLTKSRAMQHGTLLCKVDLSSLAAYLNPNKAKLISKGVSSVRARVCNVVDVAPSVDQEMVKSAIIKRFQECYDSKAEVEVMDPLVLAESQPKLKVLIAKQEDWQWRFGETPHFEHSFETRFDWGLMDVMVNSVKGHISAAKIYSDSLIPDMIDDLQSNLIGVVYGPSGVDEAVASTLSQHPYAAQELSDVRKWLDSSL